MRNLLFLFVLTLMFACDPPKKESTEATPGNTVKLEPVENVSVSPEIDSTTVDKAPEEIVPRIEEQ